MRLHDWQLHFAEFCKMHVDMPFEWGKNDCVLFAADCVLATTGTDFADGLRYFNTALSAMRYVEENGGLIAMVTKVLGDPIPIGYAKVGDVVLVDLGQGESLGIFNGSSCIGPGKDGIIALGVDAVLLAWSI